MVIQSVYISTSTLSVTGYLVLLTRQVMCEEFSKCYDDIKICLWTNGSQLTQSEAQAMCQQRNSFLPRVPNNYIQLKLMEFRSTVGNLFYDGGFWLDVRAVKADNFHWIDGSSFAG